MSKYEWRPGMAEISGLGGDYEEACREMVRVGMEWLDTHPNAVPHFGTINRVFGLVIEENDAAKAFTKAFSEAPLVMAGGGPSGAMMHAVTNACMFIRANGWEAYVTALTARTNAEEAKQD